MTSRGHRGQGTVRAMSSELSPAPGSTTDVSLLLVGGRPVLVVDVPPPADHPGGALTPGSDPLPWSFLAHGFALLPGFLGVALPETDDVVLRRRGSAWTLETRPGAAILSVDDVPAVWGGACQRNGGAVVLLGRALRLPTSEAAAAEALHEAARGARVVGAVVATDPPASAHGPTEPTAVPS